MLPVIGRCIERIQIQAGIAGSVLKGSDDRVEVGLAGGAAHAGQGQIDNIHSRVTRLQHRSSGNATGVVRVEVNGNADFLFQCLDEDLLHKAGRDLPCP